MKSMKPVSEAVEATYAMLRLSQSQLRRIVASLEIVTACIKGVDASLLTAEAR